MAGLQHGHKDLEQLNKVEEKDGILPGKYCQKAIQ